MTEFNLNNGKRELVDKSIASDLVAAVLKDGAPDTITKICLSNKSYDEDAARVVAETLSAMDQITSADLSDVIAGRPEDTALRVLSLLCNSLLGRALRSLNVKCTAILEALSDNAMGEKGIIACKSLLEQQQNTLECLFLCNNGLSSSAMELIRNIFIGDPPQYSNLRVVHFFNNMSGDGGAQAVADILQYCPKLEDFRFSGTRAGRAGSIAVAEALQHCSAAQKGQLIRLDLADNTFGEEGGLALSKMLREQKKLEFLSLRDGSLEDNGISHIAKSLFGLLSLKYLDLSANDGSVHSSRELSKAIASLAQLSYFGFEENDSLGSEGAAALSTAFLKLTALEKLQLNQCGIGTRGAVLIVESLSNCKFLTTLELNGNVISEDGLYQIKEILSGYGKQAVLGCMDENELEEEVKEETDEEECLSESNSFDNGQEK